MGHFMYFSFEMITLSFTVSLRLTKTKIIYLKSAPTSSAYTPLSRTLGMFIGTTKGINTPTFKTM